MCGNIGRALIKHPRVCSGELIISIGTSKFASFARVATLSASSIKKKGGQDLSFQAFNVISVPMPAGSPGVIAIGFSSISDPLYFLQNQ